MDLGEFLAARREDAVVAHDRQDARYLGRIGVDLAHIARRMRQRAAVILLHEPNARRTP